MFETFDDSDTYYSTWFDVRVIHSKFLHIVLKQAYIEGRNWPVEFY